MTPAELPAYLRQIIDRVQISGPRDTVDAMAKVYYDKLVDDVLIRYYHPAGTRTTSPPGQPPAVVSGALRRSIRKSPALRSGEGRASCSVAPHIVYARIQEFGGTVRAKQPHWEVIYDKNGRRRRVLKGQLHWKTDGKDFWALSVRLPARPYMRTARREVMRDGSLRRAAQEALRKIVPG